LGYYSESISFGWARNSQFTGRTAHNRSVHMVSLVLIFEHGGSGTIILTRRRSMADTATTRNVHISVGRGVLIWLPSKFRFEKNPRNRLGTVFVIKRKKCSFRGIPCFSRFMIHAADLVRIAIGAGNFDVSIMHHYLHHSLNAKVNRVIILLLQAEKEIRFLPKSMFSLKINLDRHGPIHIADISRPPFFLFTNCL
jgi:hypothetical protein